MTLDDLEHQNRGFCGFCPAKHISRANFVAINREIGKNKLRMKFSALNVDFDGPRVYFLCLR